MNGGMAMSSYKNYKEKVLQNPEVKAEYDQLQPEYDIIQAMIDARVSQNITQKELSARTGITQADISRIENGTRNPSLSMVKKLAQGLGMQLKLEFVPIPAKKGYSRHNIKGEEHDGKNAHGVTGYNVKKY
jgi:ribosome-binding protein aMBF1 (putative translation factor)